MLGQLKWDFVGYAIECIDEKQHGHEDERCAPSFP